MGEHKHNPTAIAAKKGEITPIVKPVYDKETEQRLRSLCYAAICNPELILKRKAKNDEQ